MHLSQGIGAACGFYIARRGTFLWDVLLLYGIVLGVAGETALKLWRFCHTGRESAGFSMWHLSDLPVANVGLLSTYALLQRKVVAESSRPAD